MNGSTDVDGVHGITKCVGGFGMSHQAAARTRMPRFVVELKTPHT